MISYPFTWVLSLANVKFVPAAVGTSPKSARSVNQLSSPGHQSSLPSSTSCQGYGPYLDGYECTRFNPAASIEQFTTQSVVIHETARTSSCQLKHQCLICLRKFANRRNLENHIRSAHTREKPYKCFFCSKVFCAPNTRGMHMKRHHPEKYNQEI